MITIKNAEFSSFKFSGGEIQVKVIPHRYDDRDVHINAGLFSSYDVMELILAVDAIRREYDDPKIHLVCPYLPYARQDRVMNKGEAMSLKVMCGILNSLKFASVEVWDAHSDVSLALLDNATNVEQWQFVQMIPVIRQDTVLVSPDAGALKKTMKIASNFNFGDMVRADKKRDIKTGDITGTVAYTDHIGINDFLIVDDICDGGRTFIELAKVLKPKTDGKIMLYVTHGIMSHGIQPLEDIFDKIFIANPFPGVDLSHPLIHQLKWSVS